jgi:hypothetical protein
MIDNESFSHRSQIDAAIDSRNSSGNRNSLAITQNLHDTPKSRPEWAHTFGSRGREAPVCEFRLIEAQRADTFTTHVYTQKNEEST